MAWRLPESDQSPKAVCRRPPVCVGSTDLLVSKPPGGNGSTRRLVWRSPGGAGSAKTVVWWPPGSVGPRKPVVWRLPGRSGTTWKGSNTTFAVVSKCPGDRTGANGPQVNRRTGDPRKLYFPLDLKLFSDLELLGARILSSSATGPGPGAQLALRQLLGGGCFRPAG